MAFSKRMSVISESVTLKLNALVGELQAKGENVLNFTTGELDFPPFEESKAGAIAAIQNNESKYTPAAGVPELRELVAAKTNAQQNELATPWQAANVIITNGGKQSLFNAMLVLLNDGDEVIVPAPYWLSYPEMTKLGGGVPKFVEGSFQAGFKITPSQLEHAITSRTRAFVINSPSNPTGAVYTLEELQGLGEVLARHPEVWVLSDEIYDQILFDGEKFCSFLQACPDLQDRTLTMNGMSKSGSMTGWRVGWTVGREDYIKAATKIQGQSTSGVNGPAQSASIAGLKLPAEKFSERLATLKKRRDLTLEILGKSGRIKLNVPKGAFYVFFGVGDDSVQFAERLLAEKKVALVPGTPFGAKQFVRLSFATDEKTIQEGCQRIVSFMGT